MIQHGNGGPSQPQRHTHKRARHWPAPPPPPPSKSKKKWEAWSPAIKTPNAHTSQAVNWSPASTPNNSHPPTNLNQKMVNEDPFKYSTRACSASSFFLGIETPMSLGILDSQIPIIPDVGALALVTRHPLDTDLTPLRRIKLVAGSLLHRLFENGLAVLVLPTPTLPSCLMIRDVVFNNLMCCRFSILESDIPNCWASVSSTVQFSDPDLTPLRLVYQGSILFARNHCCNIFIPRVCKYLDKQSSLSHDRSPVWPLARPPSAAESIHSI